MHHFSPRNVVAGLPTFCVYLVLTSTCCAAEDVAMVSKKATRNDVTVEVKVPAHCAVGKPLPITITVKNDTAAPLLIRDTGVVPGCIVGLINTRSREKAAYTTYGKNTVGDRDRQYMSHVFFRVLEPGEEHEWKLDLSQCFVLESATYSASIDANFSSPKTGELHTIKVDGVQFEAAK